MTAPKKRKRKNVEIITKNEGAARRRTLTVIREFLLAPRTINDVADTVGMTRRSVDRILRDARDVGFKEARCGCGCNSLILRPVERKMP